MSDFSYSAAAFDIMAEPVAALENGCIKYMNPAAVRFLGRDMTGKAASELFPCHVLSTQAGTFVTGGELCGKHCIIRAEKVLDTKVYIFSPDSDGDGINLDIALSSLRSSLATIKIAADRIAAMSAAGSDKLELYIRALNHSYYRMKRLVVNVSTADGLVKGTLPFRPAALDISKLCQDIVSSAAHFAQEKNISVALRCPSPVTAVADGELLELLILNLLSNSLQHTATGGFINVTVTDCGENVLISVDDNGEGIDEVVMQTVFAKYDHSIPLSEAEGGVGLGLTIARGIAEKHGGALVIESRHGSGTTVRATISKGPTQLELLHSPEASYGAKGMDAVLTQLADWLSAEKFGLEYED